jgi:hypothetical protein
MTSEFEHQATPAAIATNVMRAKQSNHRFCMMALPELSPRPVDFWLM